MGTFCDNLKTFLKQHLHPTTCFKPNKPSKSLPTCRTDKQSSMKLKYHPKLVEFLAMGKLRKIHSQNHKQRFSKKNFP